MKWLQTQIAQMAGRQRTMQMTPVELMTWVTRLAVFGACLWAMRRRH